MTRIPNLALWRSRAGALALLATSLLGAASSPLSAQLPEQLEFKVLLNDEPVGTHSFAFEGDPADFRVESNAAFDVRFLFVTAYRYRHRGTEVWEQGCLAEIQARTDDNGERSRVSGKKDNDGFRISGKREARLQDPCVMSFAYWDKRFLEADRLLNSQTGEVVEVTVIPEGQEKIRVSGSEVPARRYRLRASEIEILLWYDSQGRWLGLESELDGGHVLRYLPV